MTSRLALLALVALPACQPDPPREVAPPPVAATGVPDAAASTCIDLHYTARDEARRTAGLVPVAHQPGAALAAPARRPGDVVVVRPGRLTRLPLRADPADRLLGLEAASAIGGGARRTLDNLGVARAIESRGQVEVESRAEAVGAAIALHGDGGKPVMIAHGDEGVAHVVRARRYLRALPAPAPDLAGGTRHRVVEAVLGHDVDRDGVRELIVLARIVGPVDDGEVHVLAADGRARVLADPLLEGTFPGWDLLPLADGRTMWTSVGSCCDAITGRWAFLDAAGFTPLQHARGSIADAVCLDGLPASPHLRVEARPPRQ